MRSRRAAAVMAVAVVALLMSGGLALTVRAQEQPAGSAATPTGRDLALSLEGACPEKTETLVSLDSEAEEVFGRWVTIDGPTFGLEPHDPKPGIKAHAVDPLDPRRIFVSEGRSIERSLDGGCTWRQMHLVPPGPGEDLTQQYATGGITQLAISGTGETARVWALWMPRKDTVGAVRAFVSDDGGASWRERSEGLPAAYRHTTHAAAVVISFVTDCAAAPCRSGVLAPAPSNRDVAYIGLSRTSREVPFLSTRNGGRTWTAHRPVGGAFCCFLSSTDLVVDPDDEDDVWMIEGERLFRSENGGASFRENDVDLSRSPVAGLQLAREPSAALSVSVLTGYEGSWYAVARSDDGGARFDDTEFADPFRGVVSVSQGGNPSELMLSTEAPDQVYLYREAQERVIPLDVQGLGRVVAPQQDVTRAPAYWARQFDGLAAFVPGPLPGQRFPPRPRFDPRLGQLLDRPPVPGDLFPQAVSHDAGVEGSHRVDYRLDLPALPTPVDIWLLVDTSGSMAGAHTGLKNGMESIVDQLAASDLDAWYGVAVFPDGLDIPYGRYADIAPPGGELYAALERLGSNGGGNELHPTALYESVTGLGQPLSGIPPGQGASFRPEALKIIVHATDEPYGYDPEGPTDEEAAEALAAAGVRHVGLDLADGATAPEVGQFLSPVKRDHDYMARVTGTFAPPGGVDCNGDGFRDLDEGDPLTCPINRLTDSVDIAPTIVAAVRAVRDDTEVALTVAEADGLEVEITDPVKPAVNVKVPNSLPFQVTYRCPAAFTGTVRHVELLATVRGAPSARATASVGCGALPAPPASQPQARPPAPVVPMVVAPPQLVPDIEPAISPLNQTAPAHVAQPSPQPGMAAQPGQAATAKQHADRGGPAPPSPDTGQGRESSPSAATTGTIGAGAALSLAFGGWAVRRERRTAAAGARA